jgi:hypothetical protein
MQNLSTLKQSEAAEAVVVDGPIFQKEKLTQLIFPALVTKRRLQFSLIEPIKK